MLFFCALIVFLLALASESGLLVVVAIVLMVSGFTKSCSNPKAPKAPVVQSIVIEAPKVVKAPKELCKATEVWVDDLKMCI